MCTHTYRRSLEIGIRLFCSFFFIPNTLLFGLNGFRIDIAAAAKEGVARNGCQLCSSRWREEIDRHWWWWWKLPYFHCVYNARVFVCISATDWFFFSTRNKANAAAATHSSSWMYECIGVCALPSHQLSVSERIYMRMTKRTYFNIFQWFSLLSLARRAYIYSNKKNRINCCSET